MTNNSNKIKENNKAINKKIKKQEKNRIVFLLFSVVIFVVILISTVFNDAVQIMNNKKETEALLIKREELRREEASLKGEVIKLQDPEYIARYAREKYLYTKDGEKILTIIEAPNDQTKNDDSLKDDK